jgi:phage shock protein A
MINYNEYQSAQSALSQLRTAAATASAAQTIAQRNYEKAQADVYKCENEYRLAVKAANKDLASQAKYQKEKSELIAQRLKKLLDEQQQQVDKIKKSLKYWEDKISEVQKEQLVLKVNSSTNTNIFEVLENKYLDTQNIKQDVIPGLIAFEDIDEDSDLNDSLQEFQEMLLLQPLPQVKKRPDNILAEAIQETEEIITKAVAHQESIQKDFEKAQKEAKSWNEKAKIALQSNDDDLALQAVVNKKVQNKIALTIQTQIQQQEKTINLLVQNLMVLENVKKIFDTLQNQDIHNIKQIIDFKSIIIDTEIDAPRRELDNL